MSEAHQISRDPEKSALPAQTTPDTKPIKRNRAVTKRMEIALRAMIFDAEKKPEAAKKAGLTVRAIDYALANSDAAKRFVREITRARDEGLHVESIVVGAKLMRSADSEHVRLQAAQWINQLTDPTAHLRGSDTAKTLIININPQSGEANGVIRDAKSGTVRLIDAGPVIDVTPSEE